MKSLSLIVLLTVSAVSLAGHEEGHKNTSPVLSAGSDRMSANMASATTYEVKGMHCESCESSIKAKVCALPGIDKCEVSITDASKKLGKVVITAKSGSQVKEDDVKNAVQSAGGFKVVNVSAQKASH